ncbi:hypothetical protein [Mucilaginibacter sp. UYCu711]
MTLTIFMLFSIIFFKTEKFA